MTAVDAPSGRRIGFAVTLVASMAAATSFGPMLGLLGSEFLDEFRISRGQLGLLIGLSMFIGGACSPVVGLLTDRLGGRKALALTFGMAGFAYLVMAGSTVYLVLMVASFFAGISNGLTNPATNKLIATEVAPGRRGIITGIKQSGVQIGTALLGLLVPLGVIAFGWRPTVLVVAAVWLLFLPITFRVTTPVAVGNGPTGLQLGSALRRVWPIAAFGLSIGMASSFILLIPLFAEEALGLDRITAGRAAALTAASAIVGRLLWPRRAERRSAFPPTLRLLALITISGLAILAAAITAPWLIWPGALVMGISAASWNAVGMLATIVTVGPIRAGAATGWVQLGFLGGSGLATPVYGWLVDRSGSYLPALVIGSGAALLGAIVITVGARSFTAPGAGRR